MFLRRIKNNLWNIKEYLFAVFICILILLIFFDLNKANLLVPFCSRRDCALWIALVKGMISNGWYLNNPFLGAPFGYNFSDMLVVDNLSFFIMKMISSFSKNHAIVINLFLIITFPLTTISSLYVFRKFNINYLTALLGSLIYTFLPYHFIRGIAHLPLSSYYLIPLMSLVCIWVAFGEISLNKNRSRIKSYISNKKLIISIVICILVASSIAYYIYFSIFMLLVAGLYNLINSRNVKNINLILLLLGIVFLTVLVNY